MAQIIGVGGAKPRAVTLLPLDDLIEDREQADLLPFTERTWIDWYKMLFRPIAARWSIVLVQTSLGGLPTFVAWLLPVRLLHGVPKQLA